MNGNNWLWIYLDRFSVSADESTLTIFDVQPEDQGQYKCEAENIPGNWDLSYYLEVTCEHFGSFTFTHPWKFISLLYHLLD